MYLHWLWTVVSVLVRSADLKMYDTYAEQNSDLFGLELAKPSLEVASQFDDANRSMVLASTSPVDWNDMQSNGRIPACIDKDGSITIYRQHKVPSSKKIIGLHHLYDKTPSLAIDLDINQQESTLIHNRSFKMKLLQSLSDRQVEERNAPFRKKNEAAFEHSAFCSSCSTGILFPSLTNVNGSDIFVSDFLEPGFNPGYNSEGFTTVSDCYFQENPGYLVCNSPSMTSIPKNLPSNLISFEMDKTKVAYLPAGAFSGMHVLQMNLNENLINNISETAFQGIQGLVKLSIDKNSITAFNPAIFKELDSLQVLSLKDNNINLTQFGRNEPNNTSNITILPNIIYLNFANNPLGSLNEYAFSSFSHSALKELNLQSCKLQYIHPNSFVPLPHLVHVDFFNNPLLTPCFATTPLMQIPPLKQLGFAASDLKNAPAVLMENLTGSLEILNLSGNWFFILSQQVLSFTGNLIALVLEDCKIITIANDTFDNFPNLLYLYLGQNHFTEIPSNILPASLRVLSLRQNTANGFDDKFDLRTTLKNMSKLIWLDVNYVQLNELNSSVLSEAKNLHVLLLRGTALTKIEPFTFSAFNDLLLLDMSENKALKNLSANFSYGLQQLFGLYLDECSLDFAAPYSASESPFAHLTSAEHLYLSGNHIHQFPKQLIESMGQLRNLDLSYNILSTWERYATYSMNEDGENAISLSNNRITYLPEGIFDEFSRVWAVDLSDNALLCSCQNLDLQRLANKTNFTIIKWELEDAYQCTDTSQGDPILKRIQDMPAGDCQNQPYDPTESSGLIYCYIFTAITVLAMTATGFAYYRRDTIRYMWFKFRYQTRRSQMADNEGGSFKYDAFVCFNESDRQWVYNHLVPCLEKPIRQYEKLDHLSSLQGQLFDNTFQLCLHDRDFIVGRRITDNIFDSISRSRKVIIVLSRAYVESKWCMYELDLAEHRLLEENRNSLVLILLEDIPKSMQSNSLRFIMKTRTYLAWRTDIEGQRLFWCRLYQVLIS